MAKQNAFQQIKTNLPYQAYLLSRKPCTNLTLIIDNNVKGKIVSKSVHLVPGLPISSQQREKLH